MFARLRSKLSFIWNDRMSITNSMPQTRKKQGFLLIAISMLLVFSLYHVADLFFHHLNLDHDRWAKSVLLSAYLIWAMIAHQHVLNHQPFSTLHGWIVGIGVGIFCTVFLWAAVSLGFDQKYFGIVQQLHFEQQLSIWPFILMATLLVVLPTLVLILKYPKLHAANLQASLFLAFSYNSIQPIDLMWIYYSTEKHGQPVSLTMTLVKGDEKSQTWAIQPSAGFTPQQPTLKLCYSCFGQPTPVLVFGNTYRVAAKVGWFGDVAIDPQALQKLSTSAPRS